MDDAGQYQCLAENEMGAVAKVVVLVLQSESRPPRGGPWVGAGGRRVPQGVWDEAAVAQAVW